MYECFVQFQLMTGARRSESLSLRWSNVNLDEQSAFLPETKNGRPRKLPLRSDLVELLRQLSRTGERVFEFTDAALRKAWQRMCDRAELTGDFDLHVRDLRHEAISRVAEIGSNTPGGFSLLNLQAFSGHRDVRMLLRYAHLCAQGLAKRLDEAFNSSAKSVIHRGRKLLKPEAEISQIHHRQRICGAARSVLEGSVSGPIRVKDHVIISGQRHFGTISHYRNIYPAHKERHLRELPTPGSLTISPPHKLADLGGLTRGLPPLPSYLA
jgi:hypothetical protein